MTKATTNAKNPLPKSGAHGRVSNAASYAAIARQYGLPSENELIALFDVQELAKEPYPLKEIVKKVADKLDWFAQVLEGVIQPEHLAGLTEADASTDASKREAEGLDREVMFLFRDAQLTTLVSDEAAHAAFISKVVSLYPGLRSRMASILKGLRDSWTAESHGAKNLSQKGLQGNDRQNAGYFG